jgi:hypothetical protein
MPIESHVASEDAGAEPSSPPFGASLEEAAPEAESQQTGLIAPAPVWLQRVSLLVLVVFCVFLGVLVMVLPWSTRMWDNNLFIQSHPALAAVVHNGAVRGMISGVGLLDIWIGVSEAVHYRDQRR